MTKRPGSLLRIILCMVIAASPLYADNWNPDRQGDVCHRTPRSPGSHTSILWFLNKGKSTVIVIIGLLRLRALLKREREREREEERERQAREKERAETLKKREEERERQASLRMTLILLGGLVVWGLVNRIKEEKEDNKRFTLSAYNSPNSPSFPSSYAVQGIKINFSLP